MRHLLLFACLMTTAVGCQKEVSTEKNGNNGTAMKESDEVTTERAKLSPEDRALVEAQEWCVVSTDERLGSMGPPIKLLIKEQPVFICCKGCKRKAEADPDHTLAKVKELKAKKAGAKGDTTSP
jgi:hypothetical protein